ncbi:hypothetical protein [Brachyspira hampsonii]|uniref:Lipoprotein n=1 Tax=Brachyspira hampsonii 30446 TaxID=1289135 RepID=A0A2U4EW28_9SPIR|nr:hypothetical protein [Brachyspira hampsonii]EKV57166.1 hypothetical protein A966_06850 [Brachyspira hampsonii 30446]MBW5390330.1 hypothetical protein [Brachyspira hampsonii]MBW5395651.1 hypothetical protein [Brachyspira hampsonii]OEJ20751.1 hypothetical protein A9495_10390 [Brachyspira hampsonii]
MKFNKYISIIFILLAIFSCRKTELTITEPGPDFFLGKMQNGNWPGVTVDGNKLTISSGENKGEYTFEEPILGVGGVYNDGNGGYLVTVPAGDSLGTISMDKEAKEAVDEIINIVGSENALGAINGIMQSKDPNNVDVNTVIGNSNVSEEDKKRIEDILSGLSGGSHFGNPEVIKPDSSKS